MRRVVTWLIRVRPPVHSQCQDEVDSSLGKRSKCTPEYLSVRDLDKAEKKIVQRQSFPSDGSTLKGRLARLKPFEEDGILRVGGRLKHSDLQYDAKHPMILNQRNIPYQS